MTSETVSENDADANSWEMLPTLSLNRLFDALSNSTRRETLTLLRRRDKPMSLDKLVAELDGDDEELRLSLVHAHLPMLHAIELVDWDRKRQSVELNVILRQYRRLFEVIEYDPD